MKSSLPLAFGGLLLAAGAAWAEADAPTDLRPQLSLQYSYVFEDGARTDENGDGAYLAGTWNFSPRWAVELGASYHGFDLGLDDNGTARDWRETGLNLGAQYYLSRNPRFSPYLSIGAGAVRLEDRVGDTRSTDPFGEVGVGFRSLLAPRFGVRGDAMYRYIDVSDRHNAADDSFQEPVVRLGFFVPLGAAPVAPEPVAQPVAPPPPRPVAPAPEPKQEVIFEFDEAIFFGFDSATLRPEAEGKLMEAARLIQEDRSLRKVEIAGHTCDIGSAQYNLGLSERRARAVREFLVNRGGVDAAMLTVTGYGVTRPKVPNSSPENRQMNRRVELIASERQ